MNFGDAITTCFKKYATFSGRASRSEFWYFCLFCFLAGIGILLLIYWYCKKGTDGDNTFGADPLRLPAA